MLVPSASGFISGTWSERFAPIPLIKPLASFTIDADSAPTFIPETLFPLVAKLGSVDGIEVSVPVSYTHLTLPTIYSV